MTPPDNANASVNPEVGAALDRRDERLTSRDDLGGAMRGFLDRVRAGDLGSLPVVVGLVVICSIFTAINPLFLSPANLVNLLFDCATVGTISLGVVCMLMVGEIDLSVGSICGVASAILGVVWVKLGAPVPLAVAAAVASGGLIGLTYAQLFNRFGMPSFVATLAGLLAVLGLQLYILGPTGSINLPYDSALVNFGQLLVIPKPLAIALALIPGIVTLVSRLARARRRRAANLSGEPLAMIGLRAGLLTLGLELLVLVLNQSRGVPWMFAVFVLLVAALHYALSRTQWGRSMQAVGGNREAARRAGINVRAIYTSAFLLSGVFAAIGGVMAASRLASSSQQAGTADVNLNAIAAAVIGGTSLFGGRGGAYSALLGVIVIQAISSGLTLLDLSSSLRFMITGAVLAIAVIVDSIARRSRQSHGRT